MLSNHKKIAYVSLTPIPGLKSAGSYLDCLQHSVGHYRYLSKSFHLTSFHCAEFEGNEKMDETDFYFFKTTKNLWNQLAILNPDCVIVHDLREISKLSEFQECCPKAKFYFWYHGGIPGLMQRFYLNLRLRKIEAILLHSKNDLDRFKFLGKIETKKFVEIPEGSTNFTCENSSSKEFSVIWVGRNLPSKFPFESLNALRIVLHHNEKVKVNYIIRLNSDKGADSLLKLLERTKSEYGERFNYYTNAESTLVNQLMCTASFYFSLSKEESTGFSLLEGLATGCIPVVSKIASHEKIATDLPQTRWIESTKEEEVVKILNSALSSIELGIDKSIRNYFEENFSHQQLANKLAQLFNK